MSEKETKMVRVKVTDLPRLFDLKNDERRSIHAVITFLLDEHEGVKE